jgi:Calcineurin-like phosphoesterase
MRVRAAIAILATVALLAGCGGDGDPPRGGSTLEARWVDPDGNGVLERGSGEPLRDRTDGASRARAGHELARIALLTDVHVRDEESPARPTVLDRLGGRFGSVFRPHEALTAHVLDAAVRAINAQRPGRVLVLGDLIDNAQANELDVALATLRGGAVRPDSGARGYDGVQRASGPDPLFYRPDVDAPRHPGLVEEAQRPFTAAGLGAAWFPAMGNHDLLVQGEFGPTARTDALATGDRRLTSLDRDVRRRLRTGVVTRERLDRELAGGLPGRTEPVAPDPRRRAPTAGEVLRRLRAAARIGGRGPLLDYAFDAGRRVRVLMLDTARRGGESDGALRRQQVGWLRRALAAAGDRWVLVASHHGLDGVDGAAAALRLLERHPRLLATVHGDGHANRIRRRARGWDIATASLVDWPQQARMLRVLETAGGGAAIETWMVDHDAPSDAARTARELAYLDAQGGRPGGFAGTWADRNVRLFVNPPPVSRGG